MAQMEMESGRLHFELNVIINILEMSLEFYILTYGDDWKHCFVFQLFAIRLFIQKWRIKDWKHTILISLWWQAAVIVPRFKDNLKQK